MPIYADKLGQTERPPSIRRDRGHALLCQETSRLERVKKLNSRNFGTAEMYLKLAQSAQNEFKREISLHTSR
jgi:hypothetical protein